MAGVSIRNFTRRTAPRAPYGEAASAVLPSWDISLAFVGAAKARALNARLRRKSYVPNVLSYSAGDKNGEIIICLEEAKRQAPDYGLSERDFILYLFIHGLLHLKGRAHSATMEASEQKLLAKLTKGKLRANSHGTTHSDGHRHRHVPSQTGRRRRNHR